MSQRHGKVRTSAGVTSIRFDREYDHTPQRVWRALTEMDQLSRWFPADLQGEHKPGALIRIVSFAGRFPPAEGRFTAYEPCQLLEYTWGNELIRWELEQTATGCTTSFTNVLDDKALHIGTVNIAPAWHACLDVLDFVLSGETPPYSAADRFAQLITEYADLFENSEHSS